jgi:hypothetical protein
MSKEDINAKQDVLKELMQMAMEEMRNKNKHGLDEAMKLKKVSVMAPDKQGIEQGLDTAKQVIGELPGDHESEEDEDTYLDEDDTDEMPMSDEQKKELLKKMLKA